MFISKLNRVYQETDFSSSKILNNDSLLSEYSLTELDNIYKSKRFGNFQFLYKDILLKQSVLYDKSDNVNSFIYKNNKYWLDKQQRSCMRTLLDSGVNSIELSLGEEFITFPTDIIKTFIKDLEMYSHKCFINTAKHQQQIRSLEKIEDILNYDYTTGYPEKVILE